MYTSNFEVFFKFSLFVPPLIKMQCILATVCLKTTTLDLHANKLFHQKHLHTFIINASMICLQTYISNTCPLSTLSSTSANALT